MTCDDVRGKLTAYLDGELADARGSAVRGHLRECAGCRQIAGDEAALRDGLRALAPVDPPPSLWAGVQAKLARAEVADAHLPGWKRAAQRLTDHFLPAWPQFVLGGLAAAGIATFIVMRAHGGDAVPPLPPVAVAVAASPATVVEVAPAGDVTADLAHDAERQTASYADTAEELLVLANEARVQWSESQQTTFDTHVAELRGEIADAGDGRPKQKAWRALVRYLQTAAVRNEVTYAGRIP